jgi:hypothetical protein
VVNLNLTGFPAKSFVPLVRLWHLGVGRGGGITNDSAAAHSIEIWIIKRLIE